MRLSSYIDIINTDKGYFVISLITNAILKISSDITKRFNLDDFDQNTIDLLKKNGILTSLSEIDEKNFANDFLKKIWEMNNSKTSVTIVPSLFCNLTCPYCYERDYGVDSQSELMSEVHMKVVIDFLKEKDIKSIALYGGEPLLKRNKKLLKPLLEFITNEEGSINVTTNGTEIGNYEEYLHSNCISTVQITIDGMQDEHDKYRVTRQGQGSFDDIMCNIDMLIHKNVDIRIRMNVNKENLESCTNFQNMILKKYSDKKNLYVYFAPIKGEMCDFEYGEENLKHPLTNQLQLNLKKNAIASLPTGSFCSTTSKNGSFVFAPNGIWNCWHDVGLGDKKLYNYDNFKFDSSPHTELPQFSEPCVSCKYILFCAGDCLVEDQGYCDIGKKTQMFQNSFRQILK